MLQEIARIVPRNEGEILVFFCRWNLQICSFQTLRKLSVKSELGLVLACDVGFVEHVGHGLLDILDGGTEELAHGVGHEAQHALRRPPHVHVVVLADGTLHLRSLQSRGTPQCHACTNCSSTGKESVTTTKFRRRLCLVHKEKHFMRPMVSRTGTKTDVHVTN